MHGIGGQKRPSVNVLVIAGVRPQFVKVAALQRTVARWNRDARTPFRVTYVNSGQHYSPELSSKLFDDLGVTFDVDLTGVHQNLRPVPLLASMISELHQLADAYRTAVDWVVVFGDANTTLAGALAARRAGLPVAHVEAGVRWGTTVSPEEQNTVLTDHLAGARFVSSRACADALRGEGLRDNVFLVGDLALDLVRDVEETVAPGLEGFRPGEYVLCTLHHEASLSHSRNVGSLLRILAQGAHPVVFVQHPRTAAFVRRHRLEGMRNVAYVQALNFRDMLGAIKGSRFVVTDSGGVQREAYYLGKRCLVFFGQPLWRELVQVGVSRVTGASDRSIREGLAWAECTSREPGGWPGEVFGAGGAGGKLLGHLATLQPVPAGR